MLGVLLPSVVCLLLRRLVAGLRGFDQIDRNRDVLLEQRGELLTCGRPVEFGYGTPDVFLISDGRSAAAFASG